MQYAGKLYGEGGIPLALTSLDVDALDALRSRLCAALGLPADSAPEVVAEAVDGRAVVAPDLTESDIDSVWRDTEDIGDAARSMAKWAYNLAVFRARAIPADRVLGDGMVQISAELLAAYEELWNMARVRCRATTEAKLGEQWKKIDALRANQGGAEHGRE